MLSNFGYQSRI